MKKTPLLFILALSFAGFTTTAQTPGTITVKAGSPGAAIQPAMWGIFFEDINMAADGGVYAELVKNRSFEFNMPLMGWRERKKNGGEGALLVNNRSAVSPANPRYLHVTLKNNRGMYGLSNEGFRGMGIQKDEEYHFSVWAKPGSGSRIRLRIELASAKGDTLGFATLPLDGANEWKKYNISLTALATDPKAHLNVWVLGDGAVDMDMVSLFPRHTWKERPGGLRADLVQLLADLKPGFLRFPGGCIVEGRDLANRYQWKTTVGNTEDRKLIINRWNTEFSYRLTPDYYQSFGLGFYEYFLLAEDIGAAPLPILNCGMACQYNTSEVVPADELDPYVQDALDLVEFANGATTTKWGKLRADMGHPQPFNLGMLGVGNEQWGDQYIERYRIFAKAIKDKYPAIRLINSVGPSPDGDRFNYLNDTLRRLNADILDEHYYRSPDWFLKNAGRYDNYARNGPKIFAGEYAAHSEGVTDAVNRNNWQCALAEAAFMTGLERNADVVQMASYAPLFAHVDAWQWSPDLIWFDNLRSYGTPDYYVQKLFSNNKGSVVVPILQNNAAIAGQNGLYASACIDKKTGELILKLANTSAQAQSPGIVLEGIKKTGAKATLTVMKNDRPDAVNSFDDPAAVSPAVQEIAVKGKQLNLTLAPSSFTVVRVKID